MYILSANDRRSTAARVRFAVPAKVFWVISLPTTMLRTYVYEDGQEQIIISKKKLFRRLHIIRFAHLLSRTSVNNSNDVLYSKCCRFHGRCLRFFFYDYFSIIKNSFLDFLFFLPLRFYRVRTSQTFAVVSQARSLIFFSLLPHLKSFVKRYLGHRHNFTKKITRSVIIEHVRTTVVGRYSIIY